MNSERYCFLCKVKSELLLPLLKQIKTPSSRIAYIGSRGSYSSKQSLFIVILYIFFSIYSKQDQEQADKYRTKDKTYKSK